MKYKFFWWGPWKIKTHPVSLPKAYEYAKAMERGDRFPPVKIFIDRHTGQWTAKDGAHRINAARMSMKFVWCVSKTIPRTLEDRVRVR